MIMQNTIITICRAMIVFLKYLSLIILFVLFGLAELKKSKKDLTATACG